MTKIEKKERKKKVEAWFEKKSKKKGTRYTTEDFAKDAKTSYNNAIKWRNGTVPDPRHTDELRTKFWDCPIFA